MSRFTIETPLPETPSADQSAVSDDWLPRINEASNDSPSPPRTGVSFLTILLRALSAWNT